MSLDRSDWLRPCPLCASIRAMIASAHESYCRVSDYGSTGIEGLRLNASVSCSLCGDTGEVLTDEALVVVALLKDRLLTALHSGDWIKMPARTGGDA